MTKLTKKENSIIKKVHDFVKQESVGQFEDDVFENHIMNVKNFAIKLSEHYKANKFAIILACYLHDLTIIQEKTNVDHEIKASKFARKYLTDEFSLDAKLINLICDCILCHRGSKDRKRKSIEAKIVACADAMDHIDRSLAMFYRISKRENFRESVNWLNAKLDRGWKKLELPEAKQLVKKKFLAMKLMLTDKSK